MAAPSGTRWSIDGTVANALIGSQPALNLGETVSYEFEFHPVSDLPDHITRVSNFDSVRKQAGRAVILDLLDGGVRYKPQTQTDLLVSVEPGADVQGAEAIWGVIMGHSISDNTPQETIRLTLEIAYLADYSEYPDKLSVSNALKV